MTNEQIMQIIKSAGVLLEGHFLLTSGRHSNKYLQCAKLFRQTKYSEPLCAALAEKFADKQKTDENIYPQEDDFCLFCQQPLGQEAENLINNYWKYIKSIAEENAREVNTRLLNLKQEYESLDFNLFADESILAN